MTEGQYTGAGRRQQPFKGILHREQEIYQMRKGMSIAV